MNSNKAWIGIDVSKDTLDVCLLKESNKSTFKKVDNASKGFKAMLAWLRHSAPDTEFHFALEATGAYGNAVAEFLVESNLRVSVINPALTSKAAGVYNVGNRTDHTMSFVIATFCRKEEPEDWRMAAPEVRKLSAFVRRRTALNDHMTQETNRLQTPGLLKEVIKSIKKSITFLKKEIALIDKQIKDHIDNTPSLKEDHELLVSIIGIGDITANILLAEMPSVSECKDASSYPAFAGLAPYEQSSGTSVHKRTRLSKRGSSFLRRQMYLPALSAMRHNPPAKDLYERLLARGKSKMCAIGAVMRKLLLMAYGVLKNREKFDPDWSSRYAHAPKA